MPPKVQKSMVIKRKVKRLVGVFIDGVGLDRATRRISRKIDMPALVRGVCSGAPALVARYYTLIPYEDDSRHRAFLDAVGRAGLEVVVKRLPPKGVERQVSTDVEMASDIAAFALGHSDFSIKTEYSAAASEEEHHGRLISSGSAKAVPEEAPAAQPANDDQSGSVKRVIVVICPSRDLSYPLSFATQLGVDTVSADFGGRRNQDVLKSAAKWIDLSDSETIWKDEEA